MDQKSGPGSKRWHKAVFRLTVMVLMGIALMGLCIIGAVLEFDSLTMAVASILVTLGVVVVCPLLYAVVLAIVCRKRYREMSFWQRFVGLFTITTLPKVTSESTTKDG